MQFFLTVPHDSAEEPTMASMDPAELEAALAAVEEFNSDYTSPGRFALPGGCTRRRRPRPSTPPTASPWWSTDRSLRRRSTSAASG